MKRMAASLKVPDGPRRETLRASTNSLEGVCFGLSYPIHLAAEASRCEQRDARYVQALTCRSSDGNHSPRLDP
jgi:hypothetical protein